MSSANYRRILLKVSGEMLAGEQGYGIQPSILEGLASEIASVVALDIEVAVVIGGGNIFRGIAASASGMERAPACGQRTLCSRVRTSFAGGRESLWTRRRP